MCVLFGEADVGQASLPACLPWQARMPAPHKLQLLVYAVRLRPQWARTRDCPLRWPRTPSSNDRQGAKPLRTAQSDFRASQLGQLRLFAGDCVARIAYE